MNSSKIFSKKVQTILLSVGMVLYSLMPGVLAAQSNWVPPTGPPPNNNAPRPFHQGETGQAKYYGGQLLAPFSIGAFSLYAEALIGTFGVFDGPGVVASNYCFGDVGNFSSFPGNINSLTCISEDDWLVVQDFLSTSGQDSEDGQNMSCAVFADGVSLVVDCPNSSIAVNILQDGANANDCLVWDGSAWVSQPCPTGGGALPPGVVNGEIMVWRAGTNQWEKTGNKFNVKPWANQFELGTRFILRGHPSGAILAGGDGGGGGGTAESALGRACKDSQTFRIKHLSGPVTNPSFDTLHEVKCTDLVRVGEDAQFTIDGETLTIDYVDIAPSDFLILDSQNIYIQTDNNSNISSPGFNTNLFPGFSAIRSVLSTKSNGFATWRTPITIFGDNDDAGVRIDNKLFIGQVDILDDNAFEVLNPRPLCYVVHPMFGNQVVDCGSFSSGQETMFDTNGALECFNIPFGVDQLTIDAYAGGGAGGGGGYAIQFSPADSSGIAGGGGGGGSAGQFITGYEFNVPNGALNPRICANVGSGGQGGLNGFLTQHVNETLLGTTQVSTSDSPAGNGLPGGNTIVRYQDDNGTDTILISLTGGQGGSAGQYVSQAGGPQGFEPSNEQSVGPAFGGKGGAGALGTSVWWHNGGVGSTKFSGTYWGSVDMNEEVTNYLGFAAGFPTGPSIGGPGGVGQNPHASFSISGSQPPTTGECHYMANGGWEGSFGGGVGCSPSPQTSPGAGGGGGGGARGYFHIITPSWLTGYDYTARVTGGVGGDGASGRVDIVW